MRKARTMRIFNLLYSTGLKAGMPIRRFLQSPQCGPFALFFTTRATSFPPGVRIGRILLDLVLYEEWRR